MPYLKSLLSYLRNASPIRVIINGIILLIVLSWLSFIGLFVTHPDEMIMMVTHIDHIDVGGLSKISVHVDEQLEYLLASTGGDRASLSKFHDGKKDINGLHFLFSSRTNEKVLLAAAPELLLTQDIPLSFLSDITPQLLKHQCAVIDVHAGASAAREWYRQQGISGFIACPVFTGNDLAGFVQVDWIASDFDPAGKMSLIQSAATRIEGILSAS